MSHAHSTFPSHHRGLGLGLPGHPPRDLVHSSRHHPSIHSKYFSKKHKFSGNTSRYPVAMTVDGGIVSETFFGGLHNFLQIYNFVLTARILLSWFPQFAQQPFFQPLFTITNPFFNIFRGIIPPIGGLDLSPLPAFFLLSFLSNATLSLSMEPATNSKLPTKRKFFDQSNRRRRRKRGQKNEDDPIKAQSDLQNYENKLQRYLRTKRLAVPVSFVMPPVKMKKLW